MFNRHTRINVVSSNSFAEFSEITGHRFLLFSKMMRTDTGEKQQVKIALCKTCKKYFMLSKENLDSKFYNLKPASNERCLPLKELGLNEALTPEISDELIDNSRQQIYIGYYTEFECIDEKKHQVVRKLKFFKGADGHDDACGCYYCERCKKTFVRAKKNNINFFVGNPNYQTILKETNESGEIKQRDGHQLKLVDIITRYNLKYCINKSHELTPVIATVDVLRQTGERTPVKFSAMYCTKCDQYYMYESEFKRLKKLGIILCKVVEDKYWKKKALGQNVNSDESVLHMLGYNVRANNNLTASQRHKLLLMIIENKILSPYKIIEFLRWLCEFNANHPNFTDAILKWQEDISFLENHLESMAEEVQTQKITHRTPRN